MNSKKPNLHKHLFYLSLILLAISIVYIGVILNINKIWVGHDMAGLYYFSFKLLKDSLINYHQFPFWSSVHMGGFPFFAYPQMMVLYPTTLLIFIIPSIDVLLNTILILSLFAGGAFMYFALAKFDFEPIVCFIGALHFTFNGFAKWMSFGWLGRLNGYIFFPLVFLFLWKALHSKKWFKYSLLLGLSLGLQYYSSGTEMFMYSSLIFFSVFIVYFVHNRLVLRVKKAILVSFVCLLVTVIFIAPQLLQLVEFNKVSSQQGFSLEQSIGSHATIKSPLDIIKLFFKNFNSHMSARIGYLGFIFFLFSFNKIKKRYVISLLILIFITIMIGAGVNSFYYPLWKYLPGFDRMHHVNRIFGLMGFAGSFLAAVGFSVFIEKLRLRINKKAIMFCILALIAIVIVVDLGRDPNPSTYWEFQNFEEMASKNEMMQYLSEQPGIFRIHNFHTAYIAGQASSYVIEKDLQMLYGVTSVWIPEYFNIYLSVSYHNPAKFWGMLNTKYIYSNQEINSSGLRFIRKFKECVGCVEDPTADKGVSGPYLYENELVLPRAYLVDNAILIVGNKDDLRQIMYGLMVSPNFNPVNTVIVSGDKPTINEYQDGFLRRFKAIILTPGSINQDSMPLLKNYVGSGGELLPNILIGENSLNFSKIDGILLASQLPYSSVNEADHIFFSPNKQEISLRDKKGFLVMAEKFYMFQSWKAKIDGNTQDILQANGVNSAVWVSEGSERIKFEYSPSYFNILMLLAAMTLLSIVIYIIYDFKKNG